VLEVTADTNIYISGLVFAGPPRRFLRPCAEEFARSQSLKHIQKWLRFAILIKT